MCHACADDDDDDDDDLERLEASEPEPLTVTVLAAMLATSLANLARVAAGLGDDIAQGLVNHANYHIQRRQMHEQGAREIEQLTEGTDG